MFERAAAISTGINAWKISQDYDEGFRVDWHTPGKFKNLLTCTASLSMAEIDARDRSRQRKARLLAPGLRH